MSKKKTIKAENIKTAPVLRAGGQDPGKTKSYCVRDDWKDKSISNYVAFKSVDGEIQDLTVNGEPAGGGGGDIIHATVTFNVTVAEGGQAEISYNEIGTSGRWLGALYGAHYDQTGGYYATNPTIPYISSMTVQEEFIIVKPATFAINVNAGEITAVSGNASWSEGDTQIRSITGDCSITITA